MFGRFGGGGSFVAQYKCYPVSFIDRPQLENGDKGRCGDTYRGLVVTVHHALGVNTQIYGKLCIHETTMRDEYAMKTYPD